jgi:hypothetical protein
MQSKAPDHSVASPPTDAAENAKLSSGDPPPASAIPATAAAAPAESPVFDTPVTATVHQLSVASSLHNLKAEGITVGSPRIEARVSESTNDNLPSPDAAVAPKVLKGPQAKRLAEAMYELYPPNGMLPPMQIEPDALVRSKIERFFNNKKWGKPPHRRTTNRFLRDWRSGARPQ